MLKKLIFQPGIIKSLSDYAAPGRYIDAQWVRFVAGSPEKMGGFAAAIATLLTGVCRTIRCWRDNSSVARVAFGTHSKLFVLTHETLADVTPLRGRNTGSLGGALTTATASKSVTVAHAAHHQQQGDWVTLTASAAVGGLLIAGNYLIATVPDADSYTIIAASAATGNASGGGTILFVYYRTLLAPNPFATVSGSGVVTVTDPSSLVVEGDTAIFDGAAAVAGLTLVGGYIVLSADGAGYSVDAGSAANATTSGGGALVTVENELGIGFIDEAIGQGYGIGPYGQSTYGTVHAGGIPLLPRIWSLAAYGEWLLANPRGGTIYVWDPTIGGRAIGLYNAPSQCLAFFVTSERYIVALGKDGDDLKIGWADQIDPTQWVQSTTNTANASRRIQGGNFIMSGGEVRNQTSLIFTDTALFLHQWRADDYVFTDVKLGENCGLFGPNAFTVLGEVAYWVSDGQFRLWNGALDILPADDIREWFFDNVDRDQRAKVVMGTIANKHELIILYQEKGQSEINRYLLYNPTDRIWSTGAVSRTAWDDRGLFPYPFATDAAGNVWSHEVGLDGNGAAIDAFIVAAPVDVMEFGGTVLGAGSMYGSDKALDIFGFLPDFQNQAGPLSLNLLTREHAMDVPVSEGPFTLDGSGATQDLRSAGQMVGFRIESNVVGGNFRIGQNRVEVQSGGARRP